MSIHRYETKDGTRFRVRWRDPGGKLRSKTVASWADANNLNVDVKARKLRSEVLPQPSTWTLDRAWREWLDTRGADLAPATIESYSALWHAHVEGEFGAYPLSRLVAEPKLIEDHSASLARRGVGPSSRRKLLMVMSGVLRACVEWRLIPLNPVRDMRKPRAKPELIPRPFSPFLIERVRRQLQQRRGLLALSGLSDAALVSCMAYAGLRPQEALALTFGDVGERTVAVDKAITSTGKGVRIGPTKTRKPRSAPLAQPLRDDLVELRGVHGNPPGGQLIFAGPDGGPWTRWRYSNWRSRVWRPALKALAASDPELEWVQRARPYDCRGSFVSLQLRAGVPPLDVASAAGHSGEVMFRHYARVIEELVGEPQLGADEQIARARALVRDEDAATIADLTAESLKPPKEARATARNLLYGPRQPLRRSEGRAKSEERSAR